MGGGSGGAGGGAGGPPKRKRQATPNMSGASSTPAQNGTIISKGVEVAKQIIQGLRDSQGRQVYLSYQPSADFQDGATTYTSTNKSWGLDISGAGGEFITRILQLRNTSDLESLQGVTYDTLKHWMIQGWQMYEDSLETDWPDLTPFHTSGGKVIHFHGESDPSVPTASSIRYWEAVRKTMYPNLSDRNQSIAQLNNWYRLFLVPGAAHCATNPEQPNGLFPQTNLAVLIEWVEKDVVPVTLNATILQGDYKGENQQLCAWPLRPLWKGNGTVMDCVYDEASYQSWQYDFTGVPLPVY